MYMYMYMYMYTYIFISVAILAQAILAVGTGDALLRFPCGMRGWVPGAFPPTARMSSTEYQALRVPVTRALKADFCFVQTQGREGLRRLAEGRFKVQTWHLELP